MLGLGLILGALGLKKLEKLHRRIVGKLGLGLLGLLKKLLKKVGAYVCGERA